jgi:pentatricopeptide repeat protein
MPQMFGLSELKQFGLPDSDRSSSQEVSEQRSLRSAPVSVENEDDPRRYRFHSALYSAALQANVEEVQQILRSMSDAGLPPGPAALHSLVFAHVKAGQSEAALQSARDIVGMGMQLLEETYIALVYGLVEEGKVELAEGVIMSMYNSGGTTRHGV